MDLHNIYNNIKVSSISLVSEILDEAIKLMFLYSGGIDFVLIYEKFLDIIGVLRNDALFFYIYSKIHEKFNE